MRPELPSLVCRWIDRVFPCVRPRVAVIPIKRCVPVCEPVPCALPPRISYWEYLDRQNVRDADVSYALPSDPARIKSACPAEKYPCIDARKCDNPSVGLGVPTLGYVPPPKDDQVPPQRAPHHTVRISEPGVMGTMMDIVA